VILQYKNNYKQATRIRERPKNKQYGKVKGKSIPIQVWTDPEGSRR